MTAPSVLAMRAFIAGQAACRAGEPRRCPPRFVPYATAWREGFDAWQEDQRDARVA